MGNINILDSSLINKIAAGEVIERPASVVKELIENSLDANADIIKIDIEESGKALIRVTDNGLGMDAQDIKHSIIKHATSKIATLHDLFRIQTLGFRGEALASICAVAKVLISAKIEKEEKGLSISVQDGKILNEESVGMPTGTSITVKNLFYNTPARLKHLKQDATELGHIIATVTRYAIINPQVSFILIHNGKTILNCPKSPNMLNNLVSIYGKEIVKELIPLSYKNDIGHITGFVSKPSITRAERTEQHIYVNKRYIRNKTISDALYDAFHSLLFLNRHPIAVLNVDIDFSKTDVNVHPTKEIIRIEHEDLLYKLVYEAIREALEKNNLIAEAKIAYNTTLKKNTKVYASSAEVQKNLDVKKTQPPTASLTTKTIQYHKEKISYTQDEQKKREAKFHIIKTLGQLNNMYILCEDEQGLVIFDQHVVEERVNYEKFMHYFANKAVPKQTLLKPHVLNLTGQEHTALLLHKEQLLALGYNIEDYGDKSIIVRSAPAIFGDIGTDFLIDLVHEVTQLSTKHLDKNIEEKIIKFSCKRSIKAGQQLSLSQMQHMIEELRYADNPFTCPHGRPIMMRISLSQLEIMFKRTG